MKGLVSRSVKAVSHEAVRYTQMQERILARGRGGGGGPKSLLINTHDVPN